MMIGDIIFSILWLENLHLGAETFPGLKRQLKSQN